MTGVNVFEAAVMRLAIPLLICCGEVTSGEDVFRVINGTRMRGFDDSDELQDKKGRKLNYEILRLLLLITRM